jgi:hypothetical protein
VRESAREGGESRETHLFEVFELERGLNEELHELEHGLHLLRLHLLFGGKVLDQRDQGVATREDGLAALALQSTMRQHRIVGGRPYEMHADPEELHQEVKHSRLEKGVARL